MFDKLRISCFNDIRGRKLVLPVKEVFMILFQKTMFWFAALSAAFIISCGTDKGAEDTSVSVPKNGITADKVIFTVNMDETVALKDVVEGKTDVLFTKVPPSILNTLSASDRNKLDIYTIPSGSWSLWLNPIPNKAPYTLKLNSGETVFNPLAVKDLRYALNWLIDRKKIINEILSGEGDPMFTPMTPGQPGTYKYNLIPAKLGMTEYGDEKAAIEMITEAMNKAAALPENKGKLVKNGKFWQYAGKDVSIKFYIRVDDATGRLLAGRYISDQIEKAGIKVERLEWDRSRSSNSVYGADPADYICTMYTEGWGAGATRRWWDVSVCQMYAPFYGFMPGGAKDNFWNYQNERLDVLGKKGSFGQYLSEEDYWKGNLEATELGLKEAVRIYLCSNKDSFVANKAKFNSRMLYGVGDGLNGWSIRSADVKPETSGPYKGQRVLRVSQHSSRGTLFMSTWDPIGKGGFADTYSSVIINPCSITGKDEAPNTAEDIALGSIIDMSGAQMAPKLLSDGSIGGDIKVPEDAVVYDTKTKSWKKVGKNVTAAVAVKGRLLDNIFWHNGELTTIADERYAAAFGPEWAMKDSEDDPYFDQALSSNMLEDLKSLKGCVYHEDGSITYYKNYFFAPDPVRTIISVGAASGKAGNPGRQTIVPWEIYEALSEMVVHGAASKTNYNILEGGQGGVEVDVIAPECVADIKAKLQEFKETKHIPVCLKGIISEEDALRRYEASIAFIEKYGHAYISNGPLMLTKIDTSTNSIIGESFEKYPYMSDYWTKKFTIPMSSIDYIKAPHSAKQGEQASFEINVSEFVYPEDELTPMNEGKVSLRLQNEDGSETVFEAEKIAAGKYKAVIPAEVTGKLKTGTTYIVIITSAINDETPSVATSKLAIL